MFMQRKSYEKISSLILTGNNDNKHRFLAKKPSLHTTLIENTRKKKLCKKVVKKLKGINLKKKILFVNIFLFKLKCFQTIVWW